MSVNEMDHDDEERLLQSNQENDHEEFRASPASKYSKTFWHSFLLFITFIASIFSFVALEHRWKHPFTIPKISSQEVCEHATARPSWHSLPLHRRHAYTRAVQRLTTIPSRLGLNTSLYDDFTYIHIQLTWQVHHVAVSLPFHRYFVHVFEQTLQDEGGYDGLMPYWDWTLDAQSPLDSPIWDSWAGFGGNGSEAADSCVEEGILGRIAKPANYSECGYKPHCVKRVFDDSKQYGMLHSKQWNKEIVKHIIEGSKTYDELREGLENGPHRHLHLGIGGEMPTASSTNDPLFFLHHSQIDRLWWLWQQRNPKTRNVEFFGPTALSDDSTEPIRASLHDSIKMLGLAHDIAVGDVMTTKSELLCYKYKLEL